LPAGTTRACHRVPTSCWPPRPPHGLLLAVSWRREGTLVVHGVEEPQLGWSRCGLAGETGGSSEPRGQPPRELLAVGPVPGTGGQRQRGVQGAPGSCLTPSPCRLWYLKTVTGCATGAWLFILFMSCSLGLYKGFSIKKNTLSYYCGAAGRREGTRGRRGSARLPQQLPHSRFGAGDALVDGDAGVGGPDECEGQLPLCQETGDAFCRDRAGGGHLCGGRKPHAPAPSYLCAASGPACTGGCRPGGGNSQ